MSMRMILASASPRRRDLLRQAGIEPEIVPSHVQENVTVPEPDEVVRQLSLRKARDVAAGFAGENTDDVVILGADTVVSIDGRILGKPADEAEAIAMIGLLQGCAHQVYTGVTLIFPGTGEEVNFAERTDVHVCAMTASQIAAYVAAGESLDKAGAYGIQGRFAAYVSGITGDYNNVVGLPLCRVCQELVARNLYE
ncbi:MAG: Maf family protein [Clostridiales bacterium]|nr:Maf family protein [Clostridiales bacterium]